MECSTELAPVVPGTDLTLGARTGATRADRLRRVGLGVGQPGRRALLAVVWLAVGVLAVRVSLRALHRLDTTHVHVVAAAVVGWIALVALARLTDIGGWHVLLLGTGTRVRLRSSARVLTTAELVRYLPGGVLHFAARYSFAARLGVAPEAIVTTTGLDLALRLALGLIVFALSLPLWPHLPVGYLVVTALTLPALAVAAHPAVLRRAVTLVRRKTGGDRGAAVQAPSYRSVALASGWYLAGWVIRGVASWWMLTALAPQSAGRVLPLIGVTGLSWVIGVLTPFAPGGLGVREAVGVALLTQFTATPVALATMLLIRLVTTGVEFATAGLAVAIDAVGRRRELAGQTPPLAAASSSLVNATPLPPTG